MILYSSTLFLALFSAGLPAGLYSIIWEQISDRLTVAVPYVSLVRAMIAAGAVTSCILCGKGTRKRERILDLSLAGVSIETLGVIGLSLSRVFWNLLVWSFVLGMGYGMSLTLLCIVIVRLDRRQAMLQFSGTAAGAFAGAWLLSETMSLSGSWRTGCQILGIVQILTGTSAFLIRRVLMRGESFRRKLEERTRRIDLERDRQRRESHPDEETLRKAERRFMVRIACSCLAAFLCGALIMCMVLWPQGFRVTKTGAAEGITGYGAIMVALGMAAGRLLCGIFRLKRRTVHIVFIAAMAGLLLMEQYLIGRNALSDYGLLVFQFLSGAAAGPVFPSLVLLDDVRLDRDAETGLISLLPAFALGSWIVATPLTQAVVASGQAIHFPLWLLLITAGIGVCLLLSSRGEKD